MNLVETSKTESSISPVIVPCLYFHHVDGNIDHYTDYPPEKFAELCRIIADNYITITPQDVCNLLEDDRSVPENALIISFDDAWGSVLDNAIPLMQQFGLTGVIYVIAEFVGKPATWSGRFVDCARHMRRDELKDLASEGFEIGSHSLSHRRLTELPIEDGKEEISASKFLLENQLDIEIESFAYPFGEWNKCLSDCAAGIYKTAFATGHRDLGNWRNGRHALPRCYIDKRDHPTRLKDIINLEWARLGSYNGELR